MNRRGRFERLDRWKPSVQAADEGLEESVTHLAVKQAVVAVLGDIKAKPAVPFEATDVAMATSP